MKKKIVIVIILVVLIAVAGLYLKGKIVTKDVLEEDLDTNQSVVIRGDIKDVMTKVASVETTVFKKINTNKSGMVEEIYVHEGEKVSKGDKLMKITYDDGNVNLSQSYYSILQNQIELNKMKETLSKYNIVSSTNGTIVELMNKDAEKINEGMEIARVVDKSIMTATVEFAKAQVELISVGDTCEIMLNKFISTIEGVVTKIDEVSHAGTNGGILYNVEVEFKNLGAVEDDCDIRVSIVENNNKIYSLNNGKGHWKTDVVIKSEVSGEVNMMISDINTNIKKGDIIAKVSNEDYLNDIKLREMNLKSIKEEYDNNVKSNNGTIFAPIGGTIIDLDVVTGENIDETHTIAKIVDLENFQITIPVDELYINKVEIGDKATIEIKAIKGEEFTGTIEKIFNVAKSDGNNRQITYDVVIKIDKKDSLKDVKIGMSAKVKLLLAEAKDVILVPIDCIKKTGDSYIVNTIDNQGNIVEKEIKLGITSADYVEVKGEIKEGDVLIK